MSEITFPLTAANVAQVMAEKDAEIERLNLENEERYEENLQLKGDVVRLRALLAAIFKITSQPEVAALADQGKG